MRRAVRDALILALAILLFCPVQAGAQDICFSEETASRMLMELERGRITAAKMSLYEAALAEMEGREALLMERSGLLESQLAAAEEAMTRQEGILEAGLRDREQAQWRSLLEKWMIGLGAGAAGILLGLVVSLAI